MNLEDIKPGVVVKHFRSGRYYTIIRLAKDANDYQRYMVVYQCNGSDEVWIRPARQEDCRMTHESPFIDMVMKPAALPLGDGGVPRFSIVTPKGKEVVDAAATHAS